MSISKLKTPFLNVVISSFLIGIVHQIVALILPLMTIDFINDGYLASWIKGVEYLPNVIFAVFIGVLVAHYSPARSLLFSICLIIFSILGIMAVFVTGISLYFLILLNFIFITGAYTFTNARSVFIKEQFLAHQFAQVNAGISMGSQFLVLLGPLISGFLAESHGISAFVVILLLAIIGAFFTYTSFSKPIPEIKTDKMHLFSRSIDSFIYIKNNKILLYITIIAMISNMLLAMVDFLIILIGKSSLHLENYIIGILVAIGGLGGVLGSWWIGRWLRGTSRVSKLYKPLYIGLFFCSLAIAIVIININIYALAATIFMLGIFSSFISVVIWTARQLLIPKDILGPVLGATSTIFKLGMPLAIISVPLIYSYVSEALIFGSLALGFLLLTVGAMSFARLLPLDSK